MTKRASLNAGQRSTWASDPRSTVSASGGACWGPPSETRPACWCDTALLVWVRIRDRAGRVDRGLGARTRKVPWVAAWASPLPIDLDDEPSGGSRKVSDVAPEHHPPAEPRRRAARREDEVRAPARCAVRAAQPDGALDDDGTVTPEHARMTSEPPARARALSGLAREELSTARRRPTERGARAETPPSSPAARSARHRHPRYRRTRRLLGSQARASTALGKTEESRRATAYRTMQLSPRRRDASWGIKRPAPPCELNRR
jgi:hypothetical protein